MPLGNKWLSKEEKKRKSKKKSQGRQDVVSFLKIAELKSVLNFWLFKNNAQNIIQGIS